MSVFLRLFGGLRLEADDLALPGRALQKKRLALLALLGATPSGRLSRDKLSAMLWPESDTDRARHQLASSVYELRKALGEEAIVSTGDDLLLDQTRVNSDVVEFEEALAAGDKEGAVALYAGPFLDGFFVADAPEVERWVEVERTRLAHAYAKALETLAQDRADRGDALGAVEWWRKLAAHDVYNARVALRLIEALNAAGDRAGALVHARIHTEAIRGGLGVEPDPEITALASRLHAAAVDAKASGLSPAGVTISTASPAAAAATDQHSGGPEFPPRRRASLTMAAAAVILALILVTVTGGWQRMLGAFGIGARNGAATNTLPVVLMMDSPHPIRVYDEEVVQANGTNADVINDLLRDLPIQRVKETAGSYWHRHEEMRQLRPVLVLIHLSAFCSDQCEPQRIKMRAFIEYLADTEAKFLIYSRMPPDDFAASFEVMLGDLPKRFPDLRARIHTFAVTTHGTPSWKDPSTAAALKLRVKELLELR